MTKWHLFTSFANGTPIRLPNPTNSTPPSNSIEGVIRSIQKEDGSGHCWNVDLFDGQGIYRAFVRTVD